MSTPGLAAVPEPDEPTTARDNSAPTEAAAGGGAGHSRTASDGPAGADRVPVRGGRETSGVDLDPVWRALSDPTRRAILDILREGPQNTGALCARFDRLSRHGVIKHLKVLERANLITVKVQGRERINQLNVLPIQQIHERWIRPYESFWASKLSRLADEVAKDRSGG